MTQIHTTIDIDAPAELVWDVLTTFEQYPEWNPVTRIEGDAETGQRLRVTPGPDAGRMPSFTPQVRSAVPGTELVWRGKLLVRGLFDGEHSFRIERLDGERSRLVQSETFGGLLVRPILWRYREQTEANFRAANEALKQRAETLQAETDAARAA